METLDNGFRLVIDPDPHVETAMVGVWIDVGTRHEKYSQHGIAHLLEHMAFKGTHRRSALEIVETIENVGGQINAETGYNETAFYAEVLGADVGVAAEIIGDIVRNPLFDPQDLKKEQEVICQEIAEAKDDPEDYLFELVQQRAFAGTSLGRSILGSPASVRGQSPDDLRHFIHEHYRPENMIFGAAGAVDPDRMALIAKNLFGDMRASPRDGLVEASYQGGEAQDARDIDQMHLCLAYEGFCWSDKDRLGLSLLREILGGGQASRLFQKLREQHGLAYTVYAFDESYKDTGLFGFYAAAEHQRAAEISTMMQQELEDIAMRGPRPSELMRAQAQFRYGLAEIGEDPAARLERAIDQLFLHGAFVENEKILRKLHQILPVDIARIAQRILSSPPTYCGVGPENFKLPSIQKG